MLTIFRNHFQNLRFRKMPAFGRGVIIWTCLFLVILNLGAVTGYKVIYAINAGGPEHTDENGIDYMEDPLADEIGTASDYGKQLIMIGRVPQTDEILYQTERYHTSTFGYDLPIEGDGNYLLILKFCEVYFNAPNKKVFDVVLNDDHIVISDLDIFGQVGRGTAHDEYISFSVSHGKLMYKEEESEIRGRHVKVEFIKGMLDNPKVNAILLLKGSNLDSFPRLSPVLADEDEIEQENLFEKQLAEENVMEDDVATAPKHRKTSGPKQPDPYSLYDDSSIMIPVFIAFAAFIPLLFFLCKL